MEFYEDKVLEKEVLKKRFEKTNEYFKFGEVSGLTKFIDTITGWFTTKSKIYTIEEMIDAVCDENNYFTGSFAGNILSNFINVIPKDEKKDEKKEGEKGDKKVEKIEP